MFYSLVDSVASRAPYHMFSTLYRRTPSWVLEGLRHHRFIQTVRWAAKHSPFYREAFAKHQIDAGRVRKPEDLKGLFTTPDDLVRDPEKFLCKAPSIVFESSGTSGRNKQVYFDQHEQAYMGTILASGLQMMGVGPQDRVANGFDFSIWIPGMMFQQGLQTSGIFCQAFGKVDPMEVYRRIPQHRLNVILGEPTWLIRLTEIAEKQGAYPLKLLIGGAEEMPADAIPWMERVWQGARVRMCYGSVELGSGLGFQPCDYRDGYHMDNVNYLTEIVDPGEDGYGEIVFSTLSRRVMPLIRYRTRDISRILDEPCSCGLTSPRLAKLRGRRDDLIVASGGNLYPLMFENILRDIPGLGRDWQVAFYLKHIREVMEIRVETERRDLDAIEKAVIHNAAHLYPDLIKNLNLGIFELKVMAVPPQSLRHGRKLRRMVDMRYTPESSHPEVNARAAHEELEVSV